MPSTSTPKPSPLLTFACSLAFSLSVWAAVIVGGIHLLRG